MKKFIEINEKITRKRFADFYKFKGLSDREIHILYLQRMQDEYGLVMKSKNMADIIISENQLHKIKR